MIDDDGRLRRGNRRRRPFEGGHGRGLGEAWQVTGKEASDDTQERGWEGRASPTSAEGYAPRRPVVRGQFSVPAFGHQKSPPLGVSFQFL